MKNQAIKVSSIVNIILIILFSIIAFFEIEIIVKVLNLRSTEVQYAWLTLLLLTSVINSILCIKEKVSWIIVTGLILSSIWTVGLMIIVYIFANMGPLVGI